jgi:hypothetical protein
VHDPGAHWLWQRAEGASCCLSPAWPGWAELLRCCGGRLALVLCRLLGHRRGLGHQLRLLDRRASSSSSGGSGLEAERGQVGRGPPFCRRCAVGVGVALLAVLREVLSGGDEARRLGLGHELPTASGRGGNVVGEPAALGVRHAEFADEDRAAG